MSDKAVRQFYWDDEFPENAEAWGWEEWANWHQEHAPWLRDKEKDHQPILHGEINCSRKYAEFMELALNNHYKLVEALEEAIKHCGICGGKGYYESHSHSFDEGISTEQNPCFGCKKARQILAEIKQ